MTLGYIGRLGVDYSGPASNFNRCLYSDDRKRRSRDRRLRLTAIYIEEGVYRGGIEDGTNRYPVYSHNYIVITNLSQYGVS